MNNGADSLDLDPLLLESLSAPDRIGPEIRQGHPPSFPLNEPFDIGVPLKLDVQSPEIIRRKYHPRSTLL
ncbi:MAG: hypothetical protein ACREU3_10485, partial [Steroidobacteraceae bacterium]